MGGPRTQHSGHRQNPMLSSVSQTRLGSLFCLLALLALFFVPLAHQWHLHTLEGLHPLLASKQVGLQLSAPEPEEPDHHHHDPATCPICQAAVSSHYFAAPTLSLSPVISLPVQRFCNETITSIIVTPEILTSGPRAPPVSL